MSTDIVEAARDVLEEQLDALKLGEKAIEKGDAPVVLPDEQPLKSPKKSRFARNDEERRLQWEELQKTKEVKETSLTGTVKWYSILGHYGFIARDDGKGDIFVHQSAISKSKTEKYFLRTLADEEPVVFDVVQGKKGLEAANVTGPDGSEVRGSKAYRIQLRHPFHKKTASKSADAAGTKRGKKANKSSDKGDAKPTDGKKNRRRQRRDRQPKDSEEVDTADKESVEASDCTDDGTAPVTTPESEPEAPECATKIGSEALPCSAEVDAGDAALGAEAEIVAAQL